MYLYFTTAQLISLFIYIYKKKTLKPKTHQFHYIWRQFTNTDNIVHRLRGNPTAGSRQLSPQNQVTRFVVFWGLQLPIMETKNEEETNSQHQRPCAVRNLKSDWSARTSRRRWFFRENGNCDVVMSRKKRWATSKNNPRGWRRIIKWKLDLKMNDIYAVEFNPWRPVSESSTWVDVCTNDLMIRLAITVQLIMKVWYIKCKIRSARYNSNYF